MARRYNDAIMSPLQMSLALRAARRHRALRNARYTAAPVCGAASALAELFMLLRARTRRGMRHFARALCACI